MDKKKISDEFVIRIGEDWRCGSGFICRSKRKGAKLPEPFDDHRIDDWIIGEFGLEYFKNYRVKVKVTLVEEVKEEEKK